MDCKRFLLLSWLAMAVTPTIAAEEIVQADGGAVPAQVKDQRAWKLSDMQTWAEAFLKRLDAIPSYQSTVVFREKVDDELGEHRHIYLKYRREPKSIYMEFLSPAHLKGVEVLYVENQNDGKMLISPRLGTANLGTVSLRLDSPILLRGARCPLQYLNLRDLTQLCLDYIKANTAQGKSNVRRFAGAKINGRVCTCWEVDHRGDKERFVMRIFADDELQIPSRFEVHTGKPSEDKLELLQEYTFLGPDGGKKPIAIDAKLTDLDFDRNNPSYRFSRTTTAGGKDQEKKETPSKPKPGQKTNAEQQAEQKHESSSNCGCRRRGRWRR